ncbi:MAG: DUF624 domain-containing protein [Anaerolineaceae bacterium]
MQNPGKCLLSAFQDVQSVFQIIYLALRDIWDDLWTALVINLIWTVCVILIIPGPPATLALFNYSNRLAHGEIADLADFFTSFNRYWRPAWRWGIINLSLVSIFIGDIFLIGRSALTSSTIRMVQGFYITAIIICFLVQLYTIPFMLEQEKPIVRMAFRNSIVMIGKNIPFSVVLGIAIILILLFGTFLCMITFAIGGLLLADIGNRAVNNRLQRVSSKMSD